MLTTPPIVQAQDSEPFQRRLRAQRRLYADAKQLHTNRLLGVVILTATSITVGTVWESARSVIGGTAAIVIAVATFAADEREKRLTHTAASIQEEFDTLLFQLPWHDFLCKRPSGWDISRAADRGSSDGLLGWYQPPELSRLTRPLDVLICQRANLDYGAALHRAYALALALTVALTCSATGGIAVLFGYRGWDLLFGLVAPLLPSAIAYVRDVTAHIDSAKKKDAAQSKVADLWRTGLEDPSEVPDTLCRQAQDCILGFRQSNARVPDRFYRARRHRNEQTMLATCAAMADEAERRGHLHPA